MTVVGARAAELLARLPGKPSPGWPQGEPFTVALAHGTMSVEIFAPRGNDPQTPHAQDELYFVHAGSAALLVDGARHAAGAGTVLFVPARAEHRFVDLSPDFAAWVVFWGPDGGERS
jgi:mannose-6-phosphate isomerase-like protein (cupin superfamily)